MSIDYEKTMAYWLKSSDFAQSKFRKIKKVYKLVTQDIRNIISQFVKAVSSHGIHVDKALLYGSVATGKDTSDSDLDVAIVSSDFGHDRFNEGKMLTQLAWRIDARLHPVPVSADSYRNDTWVPLIHEIRLHGVEVA